MPRAIESGRRLPQSKTWRNLRVLRGDSVVFRIHGLAAAMIHQVLANDLRAERKHLRVAGIDRHAQPMHVGVPECLDAGKILDAAFARRAREWLVDAEVMAVPMNKDDGLFEGDSLALD